MINWTKAKDIETWQLERDIMQRASKMAATLGVSYPNMDILMDIDACHANGCPLKLQELLQADDFNFSHDVLGIRQHLNRKTGKLMDCFVPRYAA